MENIKNRLFDSFVGNTRNKKTLKGVLNMKLKKGLVIPIFMLIFTMILSACAADDEGAKDNNKGNDIEESEQEDNPEVNPEDTSEDNSEDTTGDLPASTFGFDRFELHVEMPELPDALVAIYNQQDSKEVHYADRFTEENLRGAEAMAQLEPILKNLKITEDLSDDEVIDQIVQAFPVKEGYTAIDAAITFSNGNTKEYHVVPQ
jgi:hypothetical protein